MMTDFDLLFRQHSWVPIRNCPDRFGLATGPVPDSPAALVGDLRALEFRVQTARDPVVVVAFQGGGLISYRRTDGRYVHTLNTTDGFARKLAQLGIDAL